MTPQPIETAPVGDGWILGLIAADAKSAPGGQPWVAVTRCDGGWCDEAGVVASPTAWVALPDPQPKPTGWAPAAGTIRIVELTPGGWTDGKGRPMDVSWRWMVHIVRPDGSADRYRDCDVRNTREEAEVAAARWVRDYGLPVEVDLLPPPPSNVVPFEGRRK